MGKTYEASEEMLQKEHKKLGYKASKGFIETLGLTNEQTKKLRDILSDKGDSMEKRIHRGCRCYRFLCR